MPPKASNEPIGGGRVKGASDNPEKAEKREKNRARDFEKIKNSLGVTRVEDAFPPGTFPRAEIGDSSLGFLSRIASQLGSVHAFKAMISAQCRTTSGNPCELRFSDSSTIWNQIKPQTPSTVSKPASNMAQASATPTASKAPLKSALKQSKQNSLVDAQSKHKLETEDEKPAKKQKIGSGFSQKEQSYDTQTTEDDFELETPHSPVPSHKSAASDLGDEDGEIIQDKNQSMRASPTSSLPIPIGQTRGLFQQNLFEKHAQEKKEMEGFDVTQSQLMKKLQGMRDKKRKAQASSDLKNSEVVPQEPSQMGEDSTVYAPPTSKIIGQNTEDEEQGNPFQDTANSIVKPTAMNNMLLEKFTDSKKPHPPASDEALTNSLPDSDTIMVMTPVMGEVNMPNKKPRGRPKKVDQSQFNKGEHPATKEQSNDREVESMSRSDTSKNLTKHSQPAEPDIPDMITQTSVQDDPVTPTKSKGLQGLLNKSKSRATNTSQPAKDTMHQPSEEPKSKASLSDSHATVRSALTQNDYKELRAHGVYPVRDKIKMVPNQLRRSITDLVAQFPSINSSKPDILEEIIADTLMKICPHIDDAERSLDKYFKLAERKDN